MPIIISEIKRGRCRGVLCALLSTPISTTIIALLDSTTETYCPAGPESDDDGHHGHGHLTCGARAARPAGASIPGWRPVRMAEKLRLKILFTDLLSKEKIIFVS
jgi:hypothetical protein